MALQDDLVKALRPEAEPGTSFQLFPGSGQTLVLDGIFV